MWTLRRAVLDLSRGVQETAIAPETPYRWRFKKEKGRCEAPLNALEEPLRLLPGAKLRFAALWSIAPGDAKPAGVTGGAR
jgi:hypothetical protein